MPRTVTRLFESHAEALRAIEDLERAGVDDGRISLVSSNADNWHTGGSRAGDPGPLGDRNRDGENDVKEGAGKGATVGGLVGGAGGLLAGLGMLAIPGLGPVVAAGWLTAMAVGAAAGAAAGGAAGGLLGALKEAGHSDEEANIYSEGVRRGGALVSVRADDGDVARIEQILQRRRGMDAAMRGEDYRAGGWSRFDQEAPPYSAEQVAAERQRLRESRSFVQDQSVDEGLDEPETAARPAGSAFSTPIRGTDQRA